VFSGVREREMTNVMTKRSCSQNLSPVRLASLIANVRDEIADLISNIVGIGDYVEYASSELHYSERVLEPPMSSTRIY
jgi:hypothetical protein